MPTGLPEESRAQPFELLHRIGREATDLSLSGLSRQSPASRDRVPCVVEEIDRSLRAGSAESITRAPGRTAPSNSGRSSG